MAAETYNPWTIVNLVFTHLAEAGLHPTLGGRGHPGEPAAALLRALGIVPTVEGDARVQAGVHDELAALRAQVLGAGETP
ncbi:MULTISPECIES: hypothetical protein [unclassified Amycolatopsis]|uniref:hypothetical protein n=1 Tax=unclassified Amycolatopsis TaxID=2618356 RepID=UPI001FF3516E|nr:hypothetical protein [Amycolatopsis sp. FBCC-B4732]UOX92032.1 hypothetical protein MUY14_15880 [Amycolatopsis sp. FBCC-B4732]